VNKVDDLVVLIAQQAEAAAASVASNFDESVRPRLADILASSAAMAIRAAAGEDVTTTAIALESRLRSLGREQQALVILEGRNLALSAAMTLLGAAAG